MHYNSQCYCCMYGRHPTLLPEHVFEPDMGGADVWSIDAATHWLCLFEIIAVWGMGWVLEYVSTKSTSPSRMHGHGGIARIGALRITRVRRLERTMELTCSFLYSRVPLIAGKTPRNPKSLVSGAQKTIGVVQTYQGTECTIR